MRDDHIIDLLDRGLAALGDEERARAEAHAGDCAECGRAYRAARVAADLVSARATAEVEPPPFFHTRVMAALRERNAASLESPLARMWRAAGSLVTAMATFVLVLGAAAYVSVQPSAPPDAPDVVAVQTLYSTEWDALEEGASPEISDDQLLTLIYDSEDIYEQGR